MEMSTEIFAKMLNCDDPFKVSVLDSIVLDIDEFYDKAKEHTINGFCEAVFNECQGYLIDMYNFAKDKLTENPNLYAGSVLNWDADLMKDAIDYLDPLKDIHWGIDSTDFYIELDNWDLYANFIGTICEDYNSRLSFRTLDHDFTSEFYGGKETPVKYASLVN